MQKRALVHLLPQLQAPRETWTLVRELDESNGAQVELITVDVRNLWRLQAQRGTFVYANYNWDVAYPLDWIVFPHSAAPSRVRRASIYPEHKSALEHLLD